MEASAGRLSPPTAMVGVSVKVTVWPLSTVADGAMSLPTVKSPPETTTKESLARLAPWLALTLSPPSARPCTWSVKVPVLPIVPGSTAVQVTTCAVPAAPTVLQPTGTPTTCKRAVLVKVTLSGPLPLVRVTLITTTAGETWSDWPSASPGNATFSPIIKELGTYLSGAGTGENRALGQDIELKLEAARYRPTATRAFLTHVPTPGQIQSDPAPLVPLGDQPLTAEAGNFLLRFREAKNPGAYLFRLTQIRAATATGGEGGEAAEYRAFAANMDAGREGDLRRASRDDIAQIASGAQLVAADDTDWVKELRKKQSDLSDSIWLVVALGLLLLAEQYLSTKLSYNTADETTTAPSAASAFREARVGTPTAAEALKA